MKNFLLAVRQLTLAGVLILIIGQLSCRQSQNIDAQAAVLSAWTNSFSLPLMPTGFTNAESAYFSYWSMDGGARVYLLLLDGSSADATNLVQILSQKSDGVFSTQPLKDPNATSHASWWHPEVYGVCDAFMLDTNNPTNKVMLTGYICSSSTNRLLFIRMSKFPR